MAETAERVGWDELSAFVREYDQGHRTADSTGDVFTGAGLDHEAVLRLAAQAAATSYLQSTGPSEDAAVACFVLGMAFATWLAARRST